MTTTPLDLSIGRADLAESVTRAVAADQPVWLLTSGSTGGPKPVEIPMSALRACADACGQVLGGPGQWLAALPATRVGGLQVLIRSTLAGIPPVSLDLAHRFSAPAFVAATDAMRTDIRRYVALVPTQVQRLCTDSAARERLASFDRVLIGGAALPGALAASLTQAGVAWTHTYGMTETSGGCLYDGIPLPGVHVAVEGVDGIGDTESSGRMLLSGPTLARRYPADPARTAAAFVTIQGRRWFRTEDTGGYDLAAERWRIRGRLDEVINTGGHKVHPDDVVAALTGLAAVADAAVVGLPDAAWGQRVAALIVPHANGDNACGRVRAHLRADPVGWVRAHLRSTLPVQALPTRVQCTQSMPLLPSGKVDTRGVKAAFTQGGVTL